MAIKHGLGRGLSSLIPRKQISDTPFETSALDVLHIDPHDVIANPYQPRSRFEEEKLQALARSIETHGMITPIIVTRLAGGKYELISGERRLRAALTLGLKEIPAIARGATDQEKFEVALIENIQRENLNAIELAKAYQRLKEEFALTQEAIAEKLGQSRSQIANVARFLFLPEEIQQSLISGEITEGHAKILASISDRQNQLNVWKKITLHRLTVRASEREVKVVSVKGHMRSVALQDPSLQEARQKLEEKLGTKVEVKGTLNRGQVVIEYFSKEELERVIENV